MTQNNSREKNIEVTLIYNIFLYFCIKNTKNIFMKHNSIIYALFTFVLLLFSQNNNAQSFEDEEYEAMIYNRFNSWVNDTIPTITDQYSLEYNDSLKSYDKLNVTAVTNAVVNNGELTILNSTSNGNDAYIQFVINEIENFHSGLPKNYRIHMEKTVEYVPSYVEQSAYSFQSPDIRITLSTDKLLVIYDFYRYIKHAYVCEKNSRQGRYLSGNDLKDIFK